MRFHGDTTTAKQNLHKIVRNYSDVMQYTCSLMADQALHAIPTNLEQMNLEQALQEFVSSKVKHKYDD